MILRLSAVLVVVRLEWVNLMTGINKKLVSLATVALMVAVGSVLWMGSTERSWEGGSAFAGSDAPHAKEHNRSPARVVPNLAPLQLLDHCSDGVHRVRNRTVKRFLTTSKIHRKYGLTNVMLIAASMFAYASIDNRAVTFPKKSPVHLESLIDLRRTEQCLSMANVMLEPRDSVDGLHLKQVSAWRLGLHLGSRQLAGSVDHANSSALLGKHRMNMGLTQHIPIVSYGDFFLRFPFYALRPLDECFYLSRIVFGRSIETAAQRQLHVMRERKISKFLALHLRLEADVLKIDRRLHRVTPKEVARFWLESIEPLVQKHSLDAVYLCSGVLEEHYLTAVTSVARVPVLWRTKRTTMVQLLTTNHEDAAVDLLIAQTATVAVSTERSTFFLAMLSRRCPTKFGGSPHVLERFRNSSLFEWDINQTSSLPEATVTTGVAGVYNYRMELSPSATTLSHVEHVGCDTPWQGHCFYNSD